MSNEAAERLRTAISEVYQYGPVSGKEMKELLDEALAAERKATVERIRAAAKAYRPSNRALAGYVPSTVFDAILDAEDAR